jgi:hypothetical protein
MTDINLQWIKLAKETVVNLSLVISLYSRLTYRFFLSRSYAEQKIIKKERELVDGGSDRSAAEVGTHQIFFKIVLMKRTRIRSVSFWPSGSGPVVLFT